MPLRLIGCKVGGMLYSLRSVFRVDLIEIGDYESINEGVIIQTHLFEDRVMNSPM